MTRFRRSSKQTLILLSVLLDQPRSWRHGYDLSRETNLKSGTLYPILIRLCDREMLDSKWEASEKIGPPPRHMYRLTNQGLTFAKEQLAHCSDKGSLVKELGDPA